MSFLTLIFFVFLFTGILVYYIVPQKYRWIVLLILSYIYYFSNRVKGAVFIIFTTVTVYGAGLILGKIAEDSEAYLVNQREILTKEEKKKYKNRIRHKKRVVVVGSLVLNFGMLAVVKYSDFVIGGINTFMAKINMSVQLSAFNIVMPIGISFFTFQAVSYVIDIYQGKYKSEKNPFKLALFVSFFPQIMQGPIGKYDSLSPQLFQGNPYLLKNIQFGMQRIGWGLFKKLVLADRAGVFVNAVFHYTDGANGALSIAGVLMYSIQLYMDFSGGIDVVIGIAEMFGIKMNENFRQPYFSKSVGEFWRRWHITLGIWMKDYIFYPFSLSKGVNKMTKWGKKHLGNHMGRTLPICFSNLLIFFIVGIWHGSEMRYLAYGLYNGIIIAFSNLMEPVYKKVSRKFHVDLDSGVWHAVQILRTFLLINIGWVFDCSVSGLKEAFRTIKIMFTNLDFSQLSSEFMRKVGLTELDYIIIVIGCVLILFVSILKEKDIHIRESLAKKPLAIRWIVYYGVFVSIIVLGYIADCSGFMYAAF